MYRAPLSIDADDPLCAASAIGNTVVGILFEKKGREIQEAIQARIKTIVGEQQRLSALVDPIKDFLKEKEAQADAVEELERERERVKEEKTSEVKRNMEEAREIERAASNAYWNKCHSLDLATERLMKDEAKKFANGWKKIDSNLATLFEHFREEEWNLVDVKKAPEDLVASEAQQIYYAQTKPTGSSSSSSCSMSSSSRSGGRITTSHSFEIEESGGPLSARLRRGIEKYRVVFQDIKFKIDELELERRKLETMARNLDPERTFKLSLEQISAFGFEDK